MLYLLTQIKYVWSFIHQRLQWKTINSKRTDKINFAMKKKLLIWQSKKSPFAKYEQLCNVNVYVNVHIWFPNLWCICIYKSYITFKNQILVLPSFRPLKLIDWWCELWSKWLSNLWRLITQIQAGVRDWTCLTRRRYMISDCNSV